MRWGKGRAFPRVDASTTLDDRFSGAPAYVHGGVVLAILDEAMAWATFVALGPAQALEAAGAQMPDPARRFIRS